MGNFCKGSLVYNMLLQLRSSDGLLIGSRSSSWGTPLPLGVDEGSCVEEGGQSGTLHSPVCWFWTPVGVPLPKPPLPCSSSFYPRKTDIDAPFLRVQLAYRSPSWLDAGLPPPRKRDVHLQNDKWTKGQIFFGLPPCQKKKRGGCSLVSLLSCGSAPPTALLPEAVLQLWSKQPWEGPAAHPGDPRGGTLLCSEGPQAAGEFMTAGAQQHDQGLETSRKVAKFADDIKLFLW